MSDCVSEHPEDVDRLDVFDIRRLEPLTLVPGMRRLRFGPALKRLRCRLRVAVVHGHDLLPYGYWASLIDAAPLVVSPWETDILGQF